MSGVSGSQPDRLPEDRMAPSPGKFRRSPYLMVKVAEATGLFV
jgi:hypothetical protein